MAAEGRWQVELLPGATAGLTQILQDHGDDAFDQALNEILPSKKIPRRQTRNTCGKPKTTIGSTSTAPFTAPSIACFPGSESCPSSESGEEARCI